MTRSKGKLVALAAVLVGIATLGVAGFASRDRIVEEYYIWKLNSKDAAEMVAAAEKLGEMRSVRAVPALLEVWIRTNEDYLRWFQSGKAFYKRPKPFALEAIGKLGCLALPSLANACDKDASSTPTVYHCLRVISLREGLRGNVDTLLLMVERDSAPGSSLYRAATDLLPKMKAYDDIRPIRASQ